MLKQDLVYVHFLAIPFEKMNCVYAFIVPPSFFIVSSSLTSKVMSSNLDDHLVSSHFSQTSLYVSLDSDLYCY